MKNKIMMLVLAFILTLAISGTVSAADTTNITADSNNSSTNSSISLQSSIDSNSPDPIISGVVLDNSTNKGMANVSIKVIQNNTLVAETLTNSNGTYSLNFTNSNTNFIVIASKLGYIPFSKTITVTSSSNPSDPNLYGTANFRLYNLLKYSGSASSYVLNVGALPDILLDIYAGKSSANVNSTSSPYATGGGTPLEVKLLTGSLLAGLLNVYSTGDEGNKTGGLLPNSIPSLEAALQAVDINAGLLNATSNSSTNPPAASGSSEVASLDVGIQLLLSLLSINADLITADSSVTPNFNTGILVSTSNAGVADITIRLLGLPLLEIEALQSNARASVNGKPGGANADFTWQVADIKTLGISILDDLTLNGHVNIGLLGLNILVLSLGSVEETTTTDGTYARASGDALKLQILGLLGGGLVNLVIGHAEAEAQVPAGGLHVNTSDLGITKTVNNSHPNYLQNVTFTLTAHNYGPDNAAGVTITDKLPAGLRFISADGAYDPVTGVWTIGDLAKNSDAILHILAQVMVSNTQITNIASITGTNYDQNSTNNQGNTTVNIGPASDLAISKIVDKTTANYHDQIRYTLTVTNHGPDQANNIMVNDYLPNGLQWVSDDSNGNYNPTTGIWTINTLTNGQSATLHILTQIMTSNTIITNIATVNNNTYDQNSTNNQNQTTTIVPAASDLGITKTVDNATPKYLENVTFTLTAHNYGPDDAVGVTVNDKLPDGLTWVSDNSNGAYNPVTGVWTIGDLAKNADAILHIIAQVTRSNTQLTNIATIYGTNYDQNSTNDQGSTTVTVGSTSDLGITKTVNNANPNYLQNVTFILTAHNYGPDNAAGVTVTDKLPDGLRFVSSNGNYDPTTGVWAIGSLANGANAVLNIIAQVMVSNTQLTNIAVINGTNYDQNSTNNRSNVTVSVGPASDLGITKTVDNAHPIYLQNVTFTLTAHNYGPDDTTGVTVTDKLPAGLKFISSDGNYDPDTGIWTIGDLAKNGEDILHIVAQAIVSNTQITNIAVINGANYDQNSTNNQSNSTVIVNAASDLSITKAVNNSTPNYKDNVIFTLTAHNNGPDNATNVTVTDKLPSGLKFVSSSGGTYNPTTGVWFIGNLANGKAAVLNIVAQVLASNTQITNIATINNSTYDQDLTNNQANATVTIGLASDLGITKTVNNARPKYLQNVTFILTAHNYGPNDAKGVTVTDILPPGLKFVSTDGAYDPATGMWYIGNLTNGGTAVLHIIAQAITPSVKLTNTGIISGTNYDQNSTNNRASATVTVGPAADLAITMTVNNAHPKRLQKITFTITAYNYGPMNAKNVSVTIKMPSGLKYISNDAKGKYNYKTGIWTIGNLNNGAKIVLHIVEQATVSNVRLTTTAAIKGTAILKLTTMIAMGTVTEAADDSSGADSNTDPNLDNNQASVTVDPYSVPEEPAKAKTKSEKTIPLQKTGIPLISMILAILLVSIGMLMPKRK